jgi:hypothetical protein
VKRLLEESAPDDAYDDSSASHTGHEYHGTNSSDKRNSRNEDDQLSTSFESKEMLFLFQKSHLIATGCKSNLMRQTRQPNNRMRSD